MAEETQKLKTERVQGYLVNNAKAVKFKIGERVKSVSLRCATLSANPVLIGWNEDASSADYLLPGESYELVAEIGSYLDGNEVRFKFQQIDGTPLLAGTNQCLMIIKREHIVNC